MRKVRTLYNFKLLDTSRVIVLINFRPIMQKMIYLKCSLINWSIFSNIT